MRHGPPPRSGAAAVGGLSGGAVAAISSEVGRRPASEAQQSMPLAHRSGLLLANGQGGSEGQTHGQQLGPVKRRYPNFSGDDPEGRPIGLGDRYTERSAVAHVASYLRRRRWLWRLENITQKDDPFTAALSDAHARSVDAKESGSAGDNGKGTMSLLKRAMPNPQLVMQALTNSRKADGFVAVERGRHEALMVKGINVMPGAMVGENARGETRVRSMRMLLQYRVHEVRAQCVSRGPHDARGPMLEGKLNDLYC